MSRSLTLSNEDDVNLHTIRCFIREVLTLSKMGILLEDDAVKVIQLGTGLKLVASIRPMTKNENSYFIDALNDQTKFIISITHDLSFLDLTADLIVKNTVFESHKIDNNSIVPVYYMKSLTTEEAKSASLKISGPVLKGSTQIDVDKIYDLEDTIDFGSVDETKSGYIIKINLTMQDLILGRTGRNFEATVLPDGSTVVPASLVIDDPRTYKLFLGNPAASRYSKEPYERWCDPSDTDCNPMRPHYGVDLTRSDGTSLGAPIIAPLDGQLTLKEKSGGGGNMALLLHDDGSTTRYLHLDRFADALSGSKVKAGEIIGYLGSTGASSGTHLHFEVYPPGSDLKDGMTSTDPIAWLRDNNALFPVSSSPIN